MQQKLQPGPHVRLREKHTPPRIPDAGERAGDMRLSGGVLCAAVLFRAVVFMSYTAKDLEEIAAVFESRAIDAANRRDDPLWATSIRVRADGENIAWAEAANILRRVTLTEPCHMEKET